MRNILFILCALLLAQGVFAKKVVVSQKQSELYIGNMTRYCDYKLEHKDIEIVNHLK